MGALLLIVATAHAFTNKAQNMYGTSIADIVEQVDGTRVTTLANAIVDYQQLHFIWHSPNEVWLKDYSSQGGRRLQSCPGWSSGTWPDCGIPPWLAQDPPSPPGPPPPSTPAADYVFPLVSDSAGLGMGITWALDDNFCDDIIGLFKEDVGSMSLISCDTIKQARAATPPLPRFSLHAWSLSL